MSHHTSQSTPNTLALTCRSSSSISGDSPSRWPWRTSRNSGRRVARTCCTRSSCCNGCIWSTRGRAASRWQTPTRWTRTFWPPAREKVVPRHSSDDLLVPLLSCVLESPAPGAVTFYHVGLARLLQEPRNCSRALKSFLPNFVQMKTRPVKEVSTTVSSFPNGYLLQIPVSFERFRCKFWNLYFFLGFTFLLNLSFTVTLKLIKFVTCFSICFSILALSLAFFYVFWFGQLHVNLLHSATCLFVLFNSSSTSFVSTKFYLQFKPSSFPDLRENTTCVHLQNEISFDRFLFRFCNFLSSQCSRYFPSMSSNFSFNPIQIWVGFEICLRVLLSNFFISPLCCF